MGRRRLWRGGKKLKGRSREKWVREKREGEDEGNEEEEMKGREGEVREVRVK